ncbi:MAG: L-rhamnose isomerase [Clostridiales bacterium]|nr:L-rhamnose isomerase [Clostridiales bacterium]
MFKQAQQRFSHYGVDVEQALTKLEEVKLSMNCWQGDDIAGFETIGESLSGGIQVTGNYPGKARNFEELTQDMDMALSLIPGKHRINLHASYAVTKGSDVDRDSLTPSHFAPWTDYAKSRGLGLDFNPTFFSHPKVKENLTLSSGDEQTRAFWIRHGIACREIAAFMAKETDSYTLCNVWIPDGFKDVPADKLRPRLRLKDALDQIFAQPLEGVIDSVESKVFGIGLEAYTVGSSEFYLTYAAQHPGVYCLMDNGHYHPMEMVSDKISALLCAFDKIPLHITRPMRWDSDHVVRLEDELIEITKELVRSNALDKALIGLDFFDASINRVAAWVIGMRNTIKALLIALLTPHDLLKTLQEQGDFTKLFMLSEEIKTLPYGEIWREYCARQQVPVDESWYDQILAYEQKVLFMREG